MITDIYLQKPGDPTYTEDGAIELEEFAILLAQIKMTLLTPTRSVLGESQYGVNEENLLFTFSDTFNKVALETEIRHQLKTHCTLLKNRNWDVAAYIVPDGTDQFRDAVHLILTFVSNVRFFLSYD